MRPARPVLVFALCLAASVPAAGQATFNPGIYDRIPFLDNPGARLARLDDPLLPEIQVAPVGWDMCGDLMRLSIDARQLRVLTDLVPANPEFTSHNNFSQLNPLWK